MVRGAFEPQRDASFDVRVTDTDALSYRSRTPASILASAEKEKTQKYLTACEERHIGFTPLVTSVDGALAPQFSNFIKRLATGLSLKWHRDFSGVLNWVRTRLAFSILRAAHLCLRGTRSKWRALGIEDGIIQS